MFVLPKGTLVHFRGMPFELLEDTPTNGLEENYNLALSQGQPSLNKMKLSDDFGDAEALFNSRGWLERALVAQGAKVTGKGCGLGQADLDIEIEGFKFNVSIRPV